MRGEVHLNRVLCMIPPFAMRALYRQIAVVEQEQFQVRIFEGRVVQTSLQVIAERPNAEVHLHPTLKEALEDAESAIKECIASERWEPHNPALPQF